MDTRPANIDYLDPKWVWPCSRFNLRLDDLFGNLYDQYNTVHIPIQEPIAFHHDVSELASIATTPDEFHALLRERREQRIQELRQCWHAVSLRIASWPPSLDGDKESAAERWGAFLHFSREFSFDTLNRYFSLFTHMKTTPPSLLPSPPTGLPSQRSRHMSSSISSTTSTASNQRVKRKISSAATSISDEDDDDGCAPRSKKLRVSSPKPLLHRHNGQPSLNGTEVVETHGNKAPPAARSVSGYPSTVRRSSRIAARTQGPAHRERLDAQTRERSRAASKERSR